MNDGTGSSIWSDEQILDSFAFEGAAEFTANNLGSEGWVGIDAELQAFAQLPPGWDGDSGEPPAADCIADARQYFATLANRNFFPPDRVLPGPNGTIVAEWHVGVSYRETEFIGHGMVEIMSQASPDAPFEHSIEQLSPPHEKTKRSRIVNSPIWIDDRKAQQIFSVAA